MARSFLFGVALMLFVTAHLSLLASFAPDNKAGPVISASAFGLRILAAIAVFYFATKCAAAKNRWQAVGMWLLGFVVAFPVSNLAINGALFAVLYTLR